LPLNKAPRYLFAFFVVLAIVMPLVSVAVGHPRYRKLLIDHAKEDAIRLARHLVPAEITIDRADGRLVLDQAAVADLKRAIREYRLVKLRIYDAGGRVVFSSDKDDVGTINKDSYFHSIVARGRAYSKVVRQAALSRTGDVVEKTVVETYVPIMLPREGGSFRGACGVYDDISGLERELLDVFSSTLLYPAVVMGVFLVVIYLVLLRLDRQILRERQNSSLLQDKQRALVLEHDKQQQLLAKVEAAKIQWEATMDCVHDMVMLTDRHFVIKRCNKAVLDFCGKGFAEILGKSCADCLVDLHTLDDIGPGETVEYQHRPTGRWYAVRVYRLKSALAEGASRVVTMHDITGIKEMTEALEAKNREIETYSAKLQRALDKITELIKQVVEDGSFGVYFENEGLDPCYEVMECRKTDCPCYGKGPVRCWQVAGTFCGGEAHGAFAEKISSCLSCDHFRRSTADPVVMIGEQFNNMMHILERKNNELQEAYAELKQTQSQMLQQEKMASIGQLAAGVAHEINNPVGFIASNLGSLQRYGARLSAFMEFQSQMLEEAGKADVLARVNGRRAKDKIDFILGDVEDLISESLEGCERVRQIVADLKGFSRVDQAERQLADINECLESTLNIVRNELKYKATVVKEYGEIEPLECYPQQLNQVFMNLLVNAAQAIETSGRITVRTWCEPGYVCVAVADNGRGIAPEDLDRIFEPFFTTKEVGQGTGLGLSIVYDIVTKNHHGEISVESAPGEGTVFTIRLPASGPEALKNAEQEMDNEENNEPRSQ